MKKLYVCLFMLFLILPSILSLFVKDSNQLENRKLTELPTSDLNFEDFLKEWSNYYNDHTPFKNVSVQFMSLINTKIDKELETDLGILGKEGWMFYKGDDGISSMNDYLALNEPNQDKISSISSYFSNLQQAIENEGGKLVVLICPNKEDVLGRYLPDKYQKNKEDLSYSQQIYQNLKEDFSNIFYPIDKLEKVDSFYRMDSHWNSLGAYSAVLEIENYLGLPKVAFEDLIFEKSSRTSGDLIPILHLKEGIYGEDDVYQINTGKDVIVTKVNEVEYESSIPFQTFTSTAENENALYVVGDSFSSAMSEFLAEDFKQVTLIHRNDLSQLSISIKEGDVVMVEVAGRYVGELDKIFNGLKIQIER